MRVSKCKGLLLSLRFVRNLDALIDSNWDANCDSFCFSEYAAEKGLTRATINMGEPHVH